MGQVSPGIRLRPDHRTDKLARGRRPETRLPDGRHLLPRQALHRRGTAGVAKGLSQVLDPARRAARIATETNHRGRPPNATTLWRRYPILAALCCCVRFFVDDAAF